MPSGIKNSFLLLGVVALLAGFDFTPGKIILQTPENPAELYQERLYLKKLEIKDLILTDLTLSWNDSPDVLIEHRKILNTLKHNSLHIYLQLNLNEDLPKWDSADWTIANDNIKEIILEAKRSGIYGIIINTDTGALHKRTYSPNRLWDPEYNLRYNDISDSFAEQIIYQRGREVIQAIESVYPQMAVAITPVGAAEPVTANYTYWHHFVNGLLSTNHKSGIKLFATVRNDPEKTIATAETALRGLLDTKPEIIPIYQISDQPADEKIIQTLQDNTSAYILNIKFSDLLQLLAGNAII